MFDAGLCQCGCGEKTNLSPYSDAPRGYVKGEPMRFLPGHWARTKSASLEYAVEDRGHDTPCWVWAGSRQLNGYGMTSIGHRSVSAHRLFWEREHGAIPDGAQIDHMCRVKACVNPAHMELVNAAVNIRRRPATKLTKEKCARIRQLRADGLLHREIAERFGVSRQTIGDVLNGRIWVAEEKVFARGV